MPFDCMMGDIPRVVDVEIVGGAGAQAGNDGASTGGAGGDGDIIRFRAFLMAGTLLTLVVGQGAPGYQPYSGTNTPGGPAGGYTTGKGNSHVGGQGGRSGASGNSGTGGGGGQGSGIWVGDSLWAESGGGSGGGGGSQNRAGGNGNVDGSGGGSGTQDRYGGIFEPTKKGWDPNNSDGVGSGGPLDGSGGGGGGGSATDPGAGGTYGIDDVQSSHGGRRGTSVTPGGATTFGASANNSGSGVGGSGFSGAGPSYANGGGNGRITLWVDGVMHQFDYTGADQTFTIP